MNSTNNRLFAWSLLDVPILMKAKHPSTSGCLMWWRYASIHLTTLPHTLHEGLHQIRGRRSANLDREDGCLKTLSGKRTLCHAILTELPRLQLTWLLCVRHSWAIRFHLTEGKDYNSIYQCKQGNRWKDLQEIPKL